MIGGGGGGGGGGEREISEGEENRKTVGDHIKIGEADEGKEYGVCWLCCVSIAIGVITSTNNLLICYYFSLLIVLKAQHNCFSFNIIINCYKWTQLNLSSQYLHNYNHN